MATPPSFGPAQPLVDRYRKVGGAVSRFLNWLPNMPQPVEKLVGIPLGDESETNAGTLPPQWRAANNTAVKQALEPEHPTPRRKPIGKQATGY